MNKTQITDFIEAQILQRVEGYEVENNKLDFKKIWYQLNSDDGKFEFLKDACAIANSYGGADGFLVIGVDDDGNVSGAAFRDSGLKNDLDLLGAIKSKVDHPFNIQVI